MPFLSRVVSYPVTEYPWPGALTVRLLESVRRVLGVRVPKLIVRSLIVKEKS